MQRRYLAFAIALAVVASCIAIMITPLSRLDDNWHAVLLVFFFGACLGQTFFASTWGAMGPGNYVWRVPLSLIWVAALAAALFVGDLTELQVWLPREFGREADRVLARLPGARAARGGFCAIWRAARGDRCARGCVAGSQAVFDSRTSFARDDDWDFSWRRSLCVANRTPLPMGFSPRFVAA